MLKVKSGFGFTMPRPIRLVSTFLDSEATKKTNVTYSCTLKHFLSLPFTLYFIAFLLTFLMLLLQYFLLCFFYCIYLKKKKQKKKNNNKSSTFNTLVTEVGKISSLGLCLLEHTAIKDKLIRFDVLVFSFQKKSLGLGYVTQTQTLFCNNTG